MALKQGMLSRAQRAAQVSHRMGRVLLHGVLELEAPPTRCMLEGIVVWMPLGAPRLLWVSPRRALLIQVPVDLRLSSDLAAYARRPASWLVSSSGSSVGVLGQDFKELGPAQAPERPGLL